MVQSASNVIGLFGNELHRNTLQQTAASATKISDEHFDHTNGMPTNMENVHPLFDFDPSQDIILIDGQPVDEFGLPENVTSYENDLGETVIQFSDGESETLHGTSHDVFLNFIDIIVADGNPQVSQNDHQPALTLVNTAPDFENDDQQPQEFGGENLLPFHDDKIDLNTSLNWGDDEEEDENWSLFGI